LLVFDDGINVSSREYLVISVSLTCDKFLEEAVAVSNHRETSFEGQKEDPDKTEEESEWPSDHKEKDDPWHKRIGYRSERRQKNVFTPLRWISYSKERNRDFQPWLCFVSVDVLKNSFITLCVGVEGEHRAQDNTNYLFSICPKVHNLHLLVIEKEKKLPRYSFDDWLAIVRNMSSPTSCPQMRREEAAVTLIDFSSIFNLLSQCSDPESLKLLVKTHSHTGNPRTVV
jgi:hypothetical protein